MQTSGPRKHLNSFTVLQAVVESRARAAAACRCESENALSPPPAQTGSFVQLRVKGTHMGSVHFPTDILH